MKRLELDDQSLLKQTPHYLDMHCIHPTTHTALSIIYMCWLLGGICIYHVKVLLSLFPKSPELDSIRRWRVIRRHWSNVDPTKAHSSNQQPDEPRHSPPYHINHIATISRIRDHRNIETAQCTHSTRGVASDDVRVMSSEIQWIDKEHGHQQDTHEKMWHGGGCWEGGVKEMGWEVGSLGRWATVTLHKVGKILSLLNYLTEKWLC